MLSSALFLTGNVIFHCSMPPKTWTKWMSLAVEVIVVSSASRQPASHKIIVDIFGETILYSDILYLIHYIILSLDICSK